MYSLLRFLPFLFAFAPVAVFAQNFSYLNNLVSQILAFINGFLVPLVFALAALVFFWGVFQYFILGAGNEEKREQGKTLMLYGIGGFVIMVALWGIVQLVITIFGLNVSQDIQIIPNVPTGQR